MPTVQERYANEKAYRQAIQGKLAQLARTGRWDIVQLQRQLAYDRLLERLYIVDDGWVLKGAAALLARDIGVRWTMDIDVYHQLLDTIALEDIKKALQCDIGDWFRFDVASVTPLTGATQGQRLRILSFVGDTPWVRFHMDLVGGQTHMVGTVEPVPALARGIMPTIEQHGYRAYPLADHIADKIAATLERYGPDSKTSSRFKDLVDLVVFTTSASFDADLVKAALKSRAQRNGTVLPPEFTRMGCGAECPWL